MNNDEARVFADNMSYRQAVMNTFQSKGIKYRKATRIKLNEMLRKLEWYENQDLIRREDAFAFINKYFDIDEECILPTEFCEDWITEKESCKDCIKKHLGKIPKAEPTVSKMEQVDKDINVRSKGE